MDPYPHTYIASASGRFSGAVSVASAGLPTLTTAPAPQFGGPGDIWSPETLLAAAIADCYIFTFRAVSGAALFGWLALECQAEGIVRKTDGAPRFSTLAIRATLTIAPGADAAKAKRLLRQADRGCLIANSLSAERTLEPNVIVASPGTGNSERPPAEAPPAPSESGS